MQAVTDQFLAGTALANHQHRAVDRRQPAHLLQGLGQGHGITNHSFLVAHKVKYTK